MDHDELRRDPVLCAVLGRLEARRRDCAPLAGKSTLNRLEHAPEGAHRYRRIGHDGSVSPLGPNARRVFAKSARLGGREPRSSRVERIDKGTYFVHDLSPSQAAWREAKRGTAGHA